MENTETAILTEVKTYEPISKEVIDQLVDDAKNVELWVKPTPEGFIYNDHLIPKIAGKIISIEPYWCLWTNKKPTKVYDTERPSEDFERRCDIKIESVDGFIICLSLPNSSYRNLCAFYKSVTGQSQQNIGEVITCLKTREVNGSFGNFVVVTFSYLDDIPF